MKNLGRFGAVLYFAAVFFVVFHNANFELRGLLDVRLLVMLLMGVLGFVALLIVVKEEFDEPNP